MAPGRHVARGLRLGAGAACRLVVPERREYDDDDELLTEAVRRLAELEERPEPDVILDINEPYVDTQFYRMHPDSPSGTISLPAGLTAVRAVHDLIRAAAITAEQGPQLLIEGRRSAPVDRFLRRVSLGSARPGSYVLTSRVPVEGDARAEVSKQLDLLSTEEPHTVVISGGFSARGVVSAMHQAIGVAHAAAHHALRTQGQVSAFYDGVERGVSANLCRALADLGSFGRHDASEYRSFEIGFGWARGMPTDESSEPILFSKNMVGILIWADAELTNLADQCPPACRKAETNKRGPGEQPRIRIVGELLMEGNMLGRRSVGSQ